MIARIHVRRLVIALAGGGLVACSIFAGIDDLQIGECKGGNCVRDGGHADGTTIEEDASPTPNPVGACGGKGPPAIRVGSGDNTFCIDTTEVTVEQYNAFLDAGVPADSQSDLCKWNTSFGPKRTPAELEAGAPPGNVPITQVNWCDADAFCKWAGKYLCGKAVSGHKTGPVTDNDLADYHAHQWLLACSAEARLRYPYGGTFDPARCNLKDLDAGGLVAVGSLPGCVGGYEGLHDMVGNAWEWYDGPCNPDGGLKVDAGEGSEADSCLIKGGAYDNVGASYDCRLDSSGLRRDFHGRNVGFRCCSD